jgi:hypothetical protein
VKIMGRALKSKWPGRIACQIGGGLEASGGGCNSHVQIVTVVERQAAATHMVQVQAVVLLLFFRHLDHLSGVYVL